MIVRYNMEDLVKEYIDEIINSDELNDLEKDKTEMGICCRNSTSAHWCQIEMWKQSFG